MTAIVTVASLSFWVSGAGASPFMNQLMNIGSAAVTNVLSGINSFSLNGAAIGQDADGDDANQMADADVGADTTVDVSGDLMADNVVGAGQSAGADQSNQEITGELDADLSAGVFLDAAAIGDVAIAQDADGDGANQQAEATAGAETDIDMDIAGTALNALAAEQESDGDQANQLADTQADAASNGVTAIVGTSNATGTTSQQASGGPVNQYITNVFNTNTFIDTLQQLTSMNILTILQTCNGECNQVANVIANALANGVQMVVGDASVNADLSQNASGDGPANQTIDNENEAETNINGEQNVLSFNAITLEQEGGEQSNQQADIDADSNADGVQVLVGSSIVDVQVSQNADGDATNQQADIANDSSSDVSAMQGIVSGNAVDISQSADADNGTTAQSIEMDADSDASGVQMVDGVSVIVTEIEQNAEGDMHNQNASVDSDSETVVTALQGIIATNDITAGQEANVSHGAGAQSMIIDPTATANAIQVVSGQSDNVSGISQDADGDANQAADITADANTDVNAGQTATAINVIDASQEQDINQGAGAQWMMITPVAEVAAVQDVSGNAGNVSGITQEDGEDMNNQQAAIDASSDTDADANQDAIAVNNLNLQQRATTNQGAVAQAGEVAPIATTTANQNVAGSSGTVSGIDQEGGGDQGNQSAAIGVDAASQVSADQNAGSANVVDITQECDVTNGACAQYFYIIPIANTVADQNVIGTAGNVTGINQEGGSGDQSNQDAVVENSAETDIDAEQDAVSANTTTVFQTCTVNMSVCAQYTEVDLNAETQAQQNVTGDASNVTTVEQSGSGDQSNQTADVTDSAVTAVDAVQDAASVNDAAILQSGSESGNQAASATGTADTTTTVNITGTSNNATAIVQE